MGALYRKNENDSHSCPASAAAADRDGAQLDQDSWPHPFWVICRTSHAVPHSFDGLVPFRRRRHTVTTGVRDPRIKAVAPSNWIFALRALSPLTDPAGPRRSVIGRVVGRHRPEIGAPVLAEGLGPERPPSRRAIIVLRRECLIEPFHGLFPTPTVTSRNSKKAACDVGGAMQR